MPHRQINIVGLYGLNMIYLYYIIVHFKQNIINCTTSQTAYVSTALTLNTKLQT